jgi:hypothetical protein
MSSGASARVKAHCPNCGPLVNADVIAEHSRGGYDAASGITDDVTFRILQCPSCEATYCQREAFCSEDSPEIDPTTGQWVMLPRFDHWPTPPRRRRPEWLEFSLSDTTLERLLREVYAALDADLRVLAAIGIRTAFDRVSELLSVNPDLTFAKKLDALVATASIGPGDRRSLEALIDAGGAAAHRSCSSARDHDGHH